MRKRRTAVLKVLAMAAVSQAAIVHPQAVVHPELNTALLGQLNVVGAFSGLSAYEYAGQNSMLSAPVPDDNIISQPGDNLYVSSLLADGSVKASCLLNDNQTVVLAGDFSHVRNQSTPGMALLDLGSGNISPMGDTDLSGQVNALVCNGSQVFVGGNFSLNGVHGVYVWENSNQSWVAPAFGGFAQGAVVETMALYNDNLIFGGSLQGLANTSLSGSSTLVQNQQEIALSQAVINATNGATGGDASNVLCPGNGGFHAAANNQPATINIEVGTSVTPSRMRLYNLDDSQGTSLFRLLTSPSESIMNLTYVDTNGTTQFCDAWCTLAPSSEQTYVDFDFVNVVPAESFELVLLEGYGSQAGINAVQFYQNNIVVSANQDINTPLSCQPVANSNSSSETTGSWQTNSQGISANITDTQQLADTSVTLRPGILSESNYTVHLYTPGCSQDGSCSQRGQVNVTVNPGGNRAPVSTIVYQTNQEIKYDEIYNGTLSDGATIELRPVSGQTLPITMVGGQATLIWQGSIGHVDIDTLFEFSPANFTTYASNGSFVPVGPSLINTLSSSLGNNSKVHALLAANQSLYIGGSVTNSTYTSLLQVENDQLQQLEADGAVTSLKALNDTALAGTSSGVYKIGSSLEQLYGVESNVVPFNLNGTDYWAFTSSNNLTLYNPSNSSFYSGQTSVNGHLAARYEVLNATFYIGSLQISTATNGGSAVLQPDLSVQPLPFEFASSNVTSLRRRDDGSDSGSDSNAIYDAAYFNSSIKIIVGHFTASTSDDSTAHNALLVVDGNSSSPVPLDGIDTNSTFYSVSAHEGLAALSGTVSGTVDGKDVAGIVFYNSTSGGLVAPPALSSNVSVSQTLFHNDSSQVAVLGAFNGTSVDCRGFCLFDTDSREWSVAIAGLEGTVHHGAFLTRDQMLFAGEFSVNGTAAHFGYYNFNNQSYDAFGADGLSGVVTSFDLGNSSSNGDLIVASGRSSNGSSFVSYYTGGDSWTALDHPLHDSSTVLGVTLLPVSSSNSSAPLQSNQILAVSGKLSMDTYGNAGTVSFDGEHWLPLLAAVGEGGEGGTINSLASQLPLRTPSEVVEPAPAPPKPRRHYMSRGRVVGVACAIAVGCVSLLVLLGLGVSKVTGRKDQYMPMRVSPQDMAQTYTPPALGPR